MTKLDKIEEILREYNNGSNISAEAVLSGIENVMNDPEFTKGDDTLRIETPAGELCAFVGVDMDNPSVGIYLMPEGGNGTIIDLAYAEVKGEELADIEDIGYKDVTLYTYADPYTEDFTQRNIIKRDDVVKALEIENDDKNVKPKKSVERD